MKLRQSIEAMLGTPEAYRLQRREVKVAARSMRAVIEATGDRCEAGEVPSDEPLFVLSAGWRSGSTLVQRLVNSGASYFLWGEPYSRSDLVPRLAESIRPITDAWPRQADVLDEGAGAPGDGWTANLHPSPQVLLESHRAFFRTLYAPPGDLGPEVGWGFKEVRLSGEHALYLRLLFPRAKLVFLVRHPIDAYASYKAWRSWYTRWPQDQIRTARAYANLWAELAGSLLAEAPNVGGVVIRYEDLVPAGTAIGDLQDLLGCTVDERVLENRVRGYPEGPSRPSGFEKRLIERRTGPVAGRLGYSFE